MTEIKNNSITNSKIQELEIEKFPMAESPHLIEYFSIMGFEELYIQEKIIKNFSQEMFLKLEEEEQKIQNLNPGAKIFKEYKCRYLPTILSSIGSNFTEPIPIEILINNVFPIPPSVIYTTIDNNIFEPNPLNIVFSNIHKFFFSDGLM